MAADFIKVKKALSALFYVPAALIDRQKLRHLEKPLSGHFE
jgi:hypothetical protein